MASKLTMFLMTMFLMGLSLPALGKYDETGSGRHYEMTGVIDKIEGGMISVKTPVTTRWISPNKADRMGLHQAKVGDRVLLVVDEANVLIDVHKLTNPSHEHHMVTGTLQYVDPFWREVKIATPEGTERFDVDSLAGSKLSMFKEGNPVILELDEDFVMIDIHPQE